MITINTDQEAVTVVNVFTVDPQHQDQLLNLLTEATEETMNDIPGFISANIHKSLDGERVVNYAQWESREAFEAMIENPETTEKMDRVAELAEFDAHLYEVVYTHEATE